MTRVALVIFFYVGCFNSVNCRCEKSFVMVCDSLLDVQYNTSKKTWTELLIQQSIYDENVPKYILSSRQLTRDLSNLKWLIINNHLKEIMSKSFTYCKNLRHLILYGNKLENIRKNSFFGFRQLLKLGLENNNIKQIEKGAFTSTHAETVDISYNQIRVLRAFVFKKCNITRLLLTHNELWRIEQNSLPDAVKHLHLDHNTLEGLPDELQNLDQLEELTISNNILSTISGLTRLHRLTKLDLSFNKIRSITDEFDNMPNLKILDLSSNLLDKLTFTGQFKANLKGAFSLFLAHNQLRNLNLNGIQSSDLRITLSGNPWNCECIKNIEKTIVESNGNITMTDCDKYILGSGQNAICIADNDWTCSEQKVSPYVYSNFRESFKNMACDVFFDTETSTA